jgi:hypothetical protein
MGQKRGAAFKRAQRFPKCGELITLDNEKSYTSQYVADIA